MRIGLHTSTSGSLENAAIRAQELGANCFQIFSASPRMWRAAGVKAGEAKKLREARDRWDLQPLVIHVNYLANLATLDAEIRSKSVASFRGELERAAVIGAEYLVLHPGNYKGQSVEQGIAAFVLGLAEAAAGFSAGKLTVLLENTVGSGTQLGGKLEELAMMRELAARETDLPIGYCLDTCHLFGAGFDITTPEGLKETVEHADRVLGLENVHVVHANDSKGKLGSHLDRHDNIGKGNIGEAAFERILKHDGLRDKAFILETPAENEGDELRDVEALKRLAGMNG